MAWRTEQSTHWLMGWVMVMGGGLLIGYCHHQWPRPSSSSFLCLPPNSCFLDKLSSWTQRTGSSCNPNQPTIKIPRHVRLGWVDMVARGEERERGSGARRPNSNTNRLEGGISRKGGDTGENMPDIVGILSCQDRPVGLLIELTLTHTVTFSHWQSLLAIFTNCCSTF